MKVRMLVGLSGHDFSVPPGGEYSCSAAEGKRMIDAGLAEPMTGSAAETTSDLKSGVEFGGRRLFGAAAAAVLRKLGRQG